MSGIEMGSLAAAAAAAGMVNAVAGGGTLLTFPALLGFGVSPMTANATSTLALVIGTAGSVYGYRSRAAAVRPWLRRLAPASLLGGLLGGMLLTRSGDSVFAKLVPFLLLFATVLFLTQGAFRRFADRAGLRGTSSEGMRGAVVFQFFVALYGGYFGAGIGILMLASLGFLGLCDIHEMNTLKTTLGSLINLVAAGYFVWAGLIDWPRAGVMTAGAVAGYYTGAHYAQQIPQKQVRRIITGIGFAISAALFWKQFR